MPAVFEIPCESEAEAKRVAKEINDVGKKAVKAEPVQKNGKWYVHVTETKKAKG